MNLAEAQADRLARLNLGAWDQSRESKHKRVRGRFVDIPGKGDDAPKKTRHPAGTRLRAPNGKVFEVIDSADGVTRIKPAGGSDHAASPFVPAAHGTWPAEAPAAKPAEKPKKDFVISAPAASPEEITAAENAISNAQYDYAFGSRGYDHEYALDYMSQFGRDDLGATMRGALGIRQREMGDEFPEADDRADIAAAEKAIDSARSNYAHGQRGYDHGYALYWLSKHADPEAIRQMRGALLLAQRRKTR